MEFFDIINEAGEPTGQTVERSIAQDVYKRQGIRR